MASLHTEEGLDSELKSLRLLTGVEFNAEYYYGAFTSLGGVVFGGLEEYVIANPKGILRHDLQEMIFFTSVYNVYTSTQSRTGNYLTIPRNSILIYYGRIVMPRKLTVIYSDIMEATYELWRPTIIDPESKPIPKSVSQINDISTVLNVLFFSLSSVHFYTNREVIKGIDLATAGWKMEEIAIAEGETDTKREVVNLFKVKKKEVKSDKRFTSSDFGFKRSDISLAELLDPSTLPIKRRKESLAPTPYDILALHQQRFSEAYVSLITKRSTLNKLKDSIRIAQTRFGVRANPSYMKLVNDFLSLSDGQVFSNYDKGEQRGTVFEDKFYEYVKFHKNNDSIFLRIAEEWKSGNSPSIISEDEALQKLKGRTPKESYNLIKNLMKIPHIVFLRRRELIKPENEDKEEAEKDAPITDPIIKAGMYVLGRFSGKKEPEEDVDINEVSDDEM